MPQIPASSSKVLICIYNVVPNSEWWSLSIIAVASENSKISCTCHILSSLTWVVWIMNFMCPTAVYFWTKNLFLETWRFSHLGVTSTGNWQHTECRESPKNVSHTKKLKSIFVLVMNWTENNLQISHFMLGLGRTYIIINIIWILAKGQTAKFVQHATKLSEIHHRPPSCFFRKLLSFK